MIKYLYKLWCLLWSECPECGELLIERSIGRVCIGCGWCEYGN